MNVKFLSNIFFKTKFLRNKNHNFCVHTRLGDFIEYGWQTNEQATISAIDNVYKQVNVYLFCTFLIFKNLKNIKISEILRILIIFSQF